MLPRDASLKFDLVRVEALEEGRLLLVADAQATSADGTARTLQGLRVRTSVGLSKGMILLVSCRGPSPLPRGYQRLHRGGQPRPGGYQPRPGGSAPPRRISPAAVAVSAAAPRPRPTRRTEPAGVGLVV